MNVNVNVPARLKSNERSHVHLGSNKEQRSIKNKI